MPTAGPLRSDLLEILTDGVTSGFNQLDGGPASIVGTELADTPGGIGEIYYFGAPPTSDSVLVSPSIYLRQFAGLPSLTANDRLDEIRVTTDIRSTNGSRLIGVRELFATKDGSNSFTINRADTTTTNDTQVSLVHTLSQSDLSEFSGADLTADFGLLVKLGLYGTATGNRRARLLDLRLEIDYTVDGLLDSLEITGLVPGSDVVITDDSIVPDTNDNNVIARFEDVAGTSVSYVYTTLTNVSIAVYALGFKPFKLLGQSYGSGGAQVAVQQQPSTINGA